MNGERTTTLQSPLDTSFSNEYMEDTELFQLEELQHAIVAEKDAYVEEFVTETQESPVESPEPPARTLLKRELRALALQRMEDSARTENDFYEIINEWDRLDANRERRERAHEVGRSDVPLEWGASMEEIVIPTPIQHIYWKQITKGEFLDAIYNCPFEMHELIEDEDYASIIQNLKDEQKELLFYLYIKGYSTLQVAFIRDQSDRNIRGVHSTILKQIMKKLLLILIERQELSQPLSQREKDFLSIHESEITASKKKLHKERDALIKQIGAASRKILKLRKGTL